MSVRPAEQMLPPTRTEADAKALRAFWRGVICGVFLTGVLGSLAAVLT